jgi:hypothetical protein
MNKLTGKPTKDLYFAAALLALGAEYESADRTDPRHIEFYFSPKKVGGNIALSGAEIVTQDLDFIESQWVNKTLVVNAIEYSDAIKRMKSIVHNG